MKRVILAVIALVASVSVAQADDQPWAAGVSEQQKADAKAKLDEGNALFLKKSYKEARAKYEEALKSWNHPAIRFNVVRCDIQLDDPIAAAENLTETLKYGSAPLDEAVYEEALSYQKLFATTIGDLDLSCSQEGAKVSLDGVVVIPTCPGKVSKRLKPASHQVVGEKAGYLTLTQTVKVVGGEHDSANVKLVPLAAAAKVTHKWATWKPWLVFGGSLAVVGIGVGLDVIASTTMHNYDTNVSSKCGTTGCNGMTMNPLSSDLKDSATTYSHVAVGMISVGAAGVVVGGVLLYMNRAQTVYEKPQLEVAPTPGGAAILWNGKF